MKPKIIALIDCNNFFVSCERLFAPQYEKKPVVVLSNNDGCVVSRSQEAKDLKIPMGVPLFKIRDEVEKFKIKLFSSNFSLYGDISNRVMNTLDEFTPEVEIYSIDEAFLNLTDLKISNLEEYGNRIVQRVKQNTGLPVSVGIAHTKTLAKLANAIAKEKRLFNCAFDLTKYSESELNEMLKELDVGEIWGIGWNRRDFLKSNGIYTAYDFKKADRTWVRSKLSVQGERTQLELQGIPCFEVDHNPDGKKGIMSTRSFGRYVTELSELEQAVSTYISIAARKMREQNCITNVLSVFIRTNRFKEDSYSNTATVELPLPTDSTSELIKYALVALKKIFKPGLEYQKAGIFLVDIVPKGVFQYDLFGQAQDPSNNRSEILMKEIDKINKKFGDTTMKYGIQGFKQKWKVKSENVSKAYTTKWEELLEVN